MPAMTFNGVPSPMNALKRAHSRYADWEDRPAVRAFLGQTPEDEPATKDSCYPYYASTIAAEPLPPWFPRDGLPAAFAKTRVGEFSLGDFNPMLNTSSYVNVTFEPEEVEIASAGMRVNIADQTIYPGSFRLHNDCLNMIGDLWHCPKSPGFDKYGCFPGAGTVGSTEGCLLAGLALKLRWRAWYRRRHGLDEAAVRAVYPNLVISSAFQACWEKFFRYMDVEPLFVQPSVHAFTLRPEEVARVCNERTIGVVAILGNHYGGQYDPVAAIGSALASLNREKGWQIGIHVASGGFVAPFQPEADEWDFRVPCVLSVSASGHKFGESVCGTGWVLWRERADLSEHVAVDVAYLGGKAESYTLNFSRPASGLYVQMYKFLRLGREGYCRLTANMLSVSCYLREGLRQIQINQRPAFVILDALSGHHGRPPPDSASGPARISGEASSAEEAGGANTASSAEEAGGANTASSAEEAGGANTTCLPVVSAMLSREVELPFDCIDLQHVLAERHWYVSGYKMSFHHPSSGEVLPLFRDEDGDSTMFRIVVKSSLTRALAADLLRGLAESVAFLMEVGEGYSQMHAKRRLKESPSSNAVVC